MVSVFAFLVLLLLLYPEQKENMPVYGFMLEICYTFSSRKSFMNM